MHVGWLLAGAVAVLLSIFHADPALAEKRIALVIGNTNYTNFAPIKTGEKDAADVGAVLKLAGFEVVVAVNLTGAVLKQVISEFGERAKDTDLVVFYFSGQAIETGGANYLMPVDASKVSRQEAIDSAVSVGKLLDSAPKKSAAIVFLDAPRTDPFQRLGEKRDVELRDASGPRFVHIAYATAPGRPLAPFDGANSAYATALLKHIRTPSLPLEQIDKAVRVETSNLTQGRQIPWSSTTGSEDIIFFAPAR